MEIGNGINPGRWMNFNGDVPMKFDEHVKQSIPGYDRVMEKIGFISQFFIMDGSNYLDIGSSTGRTIFEVVNNNYGKKFQVDAVDKSPEMVQFLRDKWLQSKPWVHEFNAWNVDIQQFYPAKKYDLVVASLVLQFIRPDHRQMLLDVFNASLITGGCLLWYEKCSEESATATEVNKQYLNSYKKSAGLSHADILTKDETLRGVMNPRSFSENLEMLEAAGFSEVSVIDKDGTFTLFMAIR
ncbi:MAG: methyltransferase domain-containing protein [Bacteroidetes bacterium]|nr:methyltransferase domain-containing protein [Bacteroidota bacterium]